MGQVATLFDFLPGGAKLVGDSGLHPCTHLKNPKVSNMGLTVAPNVRSMIFLVRAVHETHHGCWISLLFYSLNPHLRW